MQQPTLPQAQAGYVYDQPGYGSPMPQQQTTVVVMGQPGAVGSMRYDLNGVREFTYNLCDCLGDCEVCMNFFETYSHLLYCKMFCNRIRVCKFYTVCTYFLIFDSFQLVNQCFNNHLGCYGYFCYPCMACDSKYFRLYLFLLSARLDTSKCIELYDTVHICLQ